MRHRVRYQAHEGLLHIHFLRFILMAAFKGRNVLNMTKYYKNNPNIT
jgi:hypothetical protein